MSKNSVKSNYEQLMSWISSIGKSNKPKVEVMKPKINYQCSLLIDDGVKRMKKGL
jgi:hypothetical protein